MSASTTWRASNSATSPSIRRGPTVIVPRSFPTTPSAARSDGSTAVSIDSAVDPSSPHEDVVAVWLAIGKDTAVVSHESALDLWELSDVIPTAVHLTVPRAQRSLARWPPPGAIIHTSTRSRDEGDIRTNSGIRLTSPARTILDAAETGTQPEQIEMAIEQAFQRGWLDVGRLCAKAKMRDRRVANLVERALVRSGAGEPSGK